MQSAVSTVPAGNIPLQTWLPNGSWPLGQMIEILIDEPGCGELGLLAPAMAALPGQGPIVLLCPPLIPNMTAWQNWRINARRLWWIDPPRLQDTWWSAQQILQSQSVGALLFWADISDERLLRRLNLYAQNSKTLFVMFRPRRCATRFSPAALRLEIIHDYGSGSSLRVLKSRGPKPAQALGMDAPVVTAIHQMASRKK